VSDRLLLTTVLVAAQLPETVPEACMLRLAGLMVRRGPRWSRPCMTSATLDGLTVSSSPMPWAGQAAMRKSHLTVHRRTGHAARRDAQAVSTAPEGRS
jgi:hypothetical protein